MKSHSHTDEVAASHWSGFLESGMPQLIQSFNLVHSLFAFIDSGMAQRIRDGRTTREAIGGALDPEMANALLRYLTVRGVLEATPSATEPSATFAFTPRGALLCSELAFAQMGFYREAYGPVLEEMSSLLRRTKSYPTDVHRNGEALGRHSAGGFHYFGTSVTLRALENIGAKSLLDLGCGAAGFLIDACQLQPELHGVGLDVSAPAIDFARRAVAQAGLANRIDLHVGDAFLPDTWPDACKRVDAIMTVGTLHEQFRHGEEGVLTLLDRYATLMRSSSVKALIIGEPELHIDAADADFYLMHVFTKQGLPRRREAWLQVFEKSQLRCEELLDAPTLGPRFMYFVLRPR